MHNTPGNEPWRLQRYAITDPEEMPLAARLAFSGMKYGDPAATAEIAQEMAQVLLGHAPLQALIAQKGCLWLAAAAYGALESAAANLTNALAEILMEAGWQVNEFKIEREGGFDRTNYGTLSPSARKKAIRHRKISITDEVAGQLKDQIVVVIDDLRCTGTHERAIAQLFARKTQPVQVIYGYCITFHGEMEAVQEEKLNHAKVKSLNDLLEFIKMKGPEPLWNARLVKFILRHSAAELAAFWPGIGGLRSLELYWLAISKDGYCDMPPFREGFLALQQYRYPGKQSDVLLYRMRSEREGKTVVHHIQEREQGIFVDAECDHDMSEMISSYSEFKFGDIGSLNYFIWELTDCIIDDLHPGGHLRAVFERAMARDEFVCLTAPGVRNVISASNQLAREVGLRVNAWLSQQGLPTMVIRSLGRLSSGRPNYAQLSAKERSSRAKTTETLISRTEYEDFPCHVIFIDDVEVTGETSNRARQKCLDAGALSFHSAFLFKVDPMQAILDAGIEHRMNQFKVTGKLDAVVAGILGHADYQPVQRMLRLLLHPQNHEELQAFLQEHVADAILKRLYLGAMANDYLWIHAPAKGERGEYAPSVEIMIREMQRRSMLGSDGLLQ